MGVPITVHNFTKIGSVVNEYEQEADLNRKIQRGGGGGGRCTIFHLRISVFCMEISADFGLRNYFWMVKFRKRVNA